MREQQGNTASTYLVYVIWFRSLANMFKNMIFGEFTLLILVAGAGS